MLPEYQKEVRMKVLAVILAALGGYICVTNYVCIGMNFRNKKRGVDRYISAIPLMSGIMMFAAAIILLPKGLWALGFIAFLLDPTYAMLIYAIAKGAFKQ